MEMFERDNQIELSNYINGKINYEEFSQQARLWPNHKTDYEPLLQIAKASLILNLTSAFVSLL